MSLVTNDISEVFSVFFNKAFRPRGLTADLYLTKFVRCV